MSKIDQVMTILLDGGWHDLSEITHTLRINQQKLEKIIELLTEFNFVQTDKLKARISFDTKNFLESVDKDLKKGVHITRLT